MANKFREFLTSSGLKVLGGKDSESNEDLIGQTKQNEFVLHTKEPGSPFCNIKAEIESVKIGDINEAAVFCARYSKDWKNGKKDVLVHLFSGKDVYKTKGMAQGTFGVKKFRTIKVKKSDIEKFELG
jgi:predicted ribosome quality control (RQC) complex YloA/Tae2 family protein